MRRSWKKAKLRWNFFWEQVHMSEVVGGTKEQQSIWNWEIFFLLVCFISLFLYLTILFNNFSVKDMVNILGLACNHDTRKNTLKKGLLPWATLQDQNLYGSGGCWPCCYGLVIVLFWFFFVWELEKRKYIMDLFMQNTQTTQSKNSAHTLELKKKKAPGVH